MHKFEAMLEPFSKENTQSENIFKSYRKLRREEKSDEIRVRHKTPHLRPRPAPNLE